MEVKAEDMLNYMIAKTYTRHSKLTDKEFLTKLGFDYEKFSEEEALNVALFNVITALSKETIVCTENAKNINKLFKLVGGERK